MVIADRDGDCMGSYQHQLREAEIRVSQLERAIQKHHEQTTGHQMCWENDVELWRAVGIVAEHPEPPPWCEFMQRCAEYRASKEGDKK